MEADNKFDQKTQALFQKWSRFYDRSIGRLIFFEPTYQRIIGLLNERKKLAEAQSFLDVACGTAEVIFRLAPQYPSVQFVGADFTAGMLEKAKAKNAKISNVRIVEAGATSLPLADNSFDVLLCSDAFHHFLYPEKALTEFRRVLKPGGLLFLVDPAINNSFIHWLGNSFIRKWENANYYFSKKELVSLLSQNGFAIEYSEIYYFNNYFLAVKK